MNLDDFYHEINPFHFPIFEQNAESYQKEACKQ